MSQNAYERVKKEIETVAERGFSEHVRRFQSSLLDPRTYADFDTDTDVSDYLAAVNEFNEYGLQIMEAIDSNDSDDPVVEHLPQEMRYISDVRTRIREPNGPTTYPLDAWILQNHDALIYSAVRDNVTDEEFEDRLRSAAESLDTYPDEQQNRRARRSLERLYDAWDDEDLDWGRHLRDLVTDSELGLHEALLRRRVLSHEAVSYATRMLDELDD